VAIAPSTDAAESREYPARPIVGIGIVVLRPRDGGGAEVLLVRRGKPPNIGAWTLPGGAQELGETAEQAARRELLEETQLTVGALHLAANVDNIQHDEEGRVRYHYTIIDFAARWDSGVAIAGSDVSEAEWAPVDRLAQYSLWHEAHRVIALARALVGC
jgi:ADP-ribose pyrophosphatase YjhB (NUDIX family)